MKDRYLFKAKTCNGEWVAGFLHCKNDKWYISNKAGSPFAYEVRPDTICQCTGLKDKNGKLIWENDVVKDKHGNFYKTFWQNNYYQFSWICVKSDVFSIGTKWDLWSFRSFEIEVIGNIFDNPELIKESDT